MARTMTRRVSPPHASRPLRRVRLPLLLAGLAALLFSTLVVLWGLSRAADRTSVWQLSRPLSAGTRLSQDALIPVGVAADTGLVELVLSSDTSVVGLVTTHALAGGELLSRSDVSEAPTLAAGEVAVGAVLKEGRAPSDLARGDAVLAVSVDGPVAPVRARVLELGSVSTSTQVAGSPGVRQGVEVVLAVPAGDAPGLAQWAGNDKLSLIREARSS
jgi:hypothetical protein